MVNYIVKNKINDVQDLMHFNEEIMNWIQLIPQNLT